MHSGVGKCVQDQENRKRGAGPRAVRCEWAAWAVCRAGTSDLSAVPVRELKCEAPQARVFEVFHPERKHIFLEEILKRKIGRKERVGGGEVGWRRRAIKLIRP
jgi:hypothetical protein